jgi:hypothetical protein
VRWWSVLRGLVAVAVLGGLVALVVRQLRRAEPGDFVLPVAIPILLLGIAGVAELQARVARWLVSRAAVRPAGDAVADFDESETGARSAPEAARTSYECLCGIVRGVLVFPLIVSPGIAALLVTVQQAEVAQERAITHVYGEAAYAAGVRIRKGGVLSTGAPADPAAVDLLHRRPVLPELVGFALTLLTADWLRRRYYGEGYNGDRPLIDLGSARERLVGWWRGRKGKAS